MFLWPISALTVLGLHIPPPPPYLQATKYYVWVLAYSPPLSGGFWSIVLRPGCAWLHWNLRKSASWLASSTAKFQQTNVSRVVRYVCTRWRGDGLTGLVGALSFNRSTIFIINIIYPHSDDVGDCLWFCWKIFLVCRVKSRLYYYYYYCYYIPSSNQQKQFGQPMM